MENSNNSGLFRLAMLSALILLLASGDGAADITLIDTDIRPTIINERRVTLLQVTLQDGTKRKLRIRGAVVEESLKYECEATVYEDIGSLTFVEKMLATETFSSSAEENARRAELREYIENKREELRVAFIDKFPTPESKPITCNLVLQPDDLIYMRLSFEGPSSSNVEVKCLGEGDARAQIRNPATMKKLKDKEKAIAMLKFIPTNCGIEPLIGADSLYIDELGAVKSRCDPVKNVTITNCRIRGRITASSFQDDLLTFSMVRADHVERLRQSAAQHVTFSNVQIIGRYQGAVHFLPGVHHFTIEDSEILGGFLSMTIHLPADGGWNVIKNNKITGQRKKGRWAGSYKGKKREVISIDSSEHNRIVNNHISDMKYGGIHLYRNCGEKGDIRHRIPQYNQIINNVFDHSISRMTKPTIFVGSRDDKRVKYGVGVKRYCHEDEGKNGKRFTGNDVLMPWDTETVRNSSESNSDWAQHNVIADNQLISAPDWDGIIFSSKAGIIFSSKAKKLDNYLIGNEVTDKNNRTLEEALDIQSARGAGCAVLAGVTQGMQDPYVNSVRNGNIPYIRNTWIVKYFWDIRPEVRLACGTTLVCQNNILAANLATTCEEPIIYDFGNEAQECIAENNVCAEASNAGDAHTLGCPSRGNLIGIQAACNLEFGKATDAQRRRVLLNRVQVVRASDPKDDGRCTADETKIKEGQRLVLPWRFKYYDGVNTPNEIRYACKEHDKNGGDCHINVRHYCEPDSLGSPGSLGNTVL